MAEIIELPENIIGKEDHEKLESFGGHEISHGRATRYHWSEDNEGSPVFEIFRGGADEELVVRISRSREKHEYLVHDKNGRIVTEGTLDHIMAGLDNKLAIEHGEQPPIPPSTPPA